jgi:hypothetical protein
MLRPHSGAAIPPSTITATTTTRLRFIIAVHAVGADVRAFEGVDVVCDLGNDPWPWADHSVDVAHASHVVAPVDEKVSAEHSVHVVAPAELEVPARHRTGDASAVAQLEPAGQVVHVVAPAAL